MKYNYYNIDKNFHYLKMTSKKFVHININDENIEKELEYLEKKL
jgi:cation transport regulator ChaC